MLLIKKKDSEKQKNIEGLIYIHMHACILKIEINIFQNIEIYNLIKLYNSSQDFDIQIC